MDPVTAAGLASAIISFVSFAHHVVERLVEFNSKLDDVPESFQGISHELPLLIDVIRRINKSVYSETHDAVTRVALKRILDRCEGQVTKLQTILNDVTPSPGAQWIERSKKAIKSLNIDDKVQAIQKELDHCMQSLVLHQVTGEHRNERDDFLGALWFDEISAPHIKDPSEGTCQWLSGNNEFKEWASDKEGVFWLKGTPGSGKSVLMRSKCRQMQHEKLTNSIYENPIVVAGFFFNARGKPESKSTTGLYRALIHQIISQVPALYEHITTDVKTTIRHVISSLTSLQTLFSQLITTKIPISAVVFIDALDECEDDSTDLLLSFLDSIDQARESNGNMKLCFSSRPDSKYDIGTYYSLDLQTLNGKDILKYIHNEINKVGRRLSAAGRDKKLLELQTLAPVVAKMANGMFLWVSLVIPQLRDAILRHYTKPQLEEMLSQIPTKLDELFKDILKHIVHSEVGTSVRQTILMFEWIVFAERPLVLSELISATNLQDFEKSNPNANIIGSKDNKLDYDELVDRITSQCGGLVQVLKESSTVQPIHQTVKEYFITGHGFKQLGLSHQRNTIAYANNILGRSCATILNVKEVQDLVDEKSFDIAIEKHHLLKYAVDFCFIHAEKAEEGGIVQDGLIDLFEFTEPGHFRNYVSLRDWHMSEHWRVCPRDEYFRPLYGPETSLIYVAAEHNLKSCVSRLISFGTDPNTPGGSFGSPLQVAAEKGHCEVVRILLENGALTDPLSLEFAVTDQQITTLKVLASNGLSEEERAKAMVAAAMNGNHEVVKALLETSVARSDIQKKEIIKALSILTPMLMDRPHCVEPRRNHSNCSRSACKLINYVYNKWELAHVREDCLCKLVEFDAAPIIERDRAPIIKRIENQSEFTLTSTDYDARYIAISHTWAHGLGNPVENSLPACQLERLDALVSSIGGNGTGFWIDTLCVPTKSVQAKRMAISRMMSNYFSEAVSVLVLDKSIEQTSGSCFEKVAVLSMSTWTRRLWLLAEQRSARRLYFQFKDMALSSKDLMDALYDELSGDPKTAMPVSAVSVIASGAVLSTYTSSTSRIARRQHEHHQQLVALSRIFRRRNVAVATDESILLAMLLDLDIRGVLEIPGDHGGKMQKVLMMCGSVPQDILFLDGLKLSGEPFCWAPSSFFGLKETFNKTSPANPEARITERGLMVQYQGMRLQWPASPVTGPLHISCTEQQNRSFYTLVNSQNAVDDFSDSATWRDVESPALILRGNPGPSDIGVLVSFPNSIVGWDDDFDPEILQVKYICRVTLYKENHLLREPLAIGSWTKSLQKWCVG